MSVGKRIYLQREMPDPEIVEQFKSIPASNTADVMGRSCAMNPRIHLVSKPKAQMMAGPAYTVKCRAGDNLTLHAALNFCQEGDVLVVSNEEDDTRALMGEIMMAYLKYTKKIAGIVLDGPIRDIDEIGNWDFPVYCTGTTPAPAPPRAAPTRRAPVRSTCPSPAAASASTPATSSWPTPTASSSSPARTPL